EELGALRVPRRYGHRRARIGHARLGEDDGLGPVLDLERRSLRDLVGTDHRECGDDQSGDRERGDAEEDGCDETDALDQNSALMSAVRALVTAGSSAPRTSKSSRTRRRRDSLSSPAVVPMGGVRRVKAPLALPPTTSASAAAFAASTSLGFASAAAMSSAGSLSMRRRPSPARARPNFASSSAGEVASAALNRFSAVSKSPLARASS